MAEVALTRPAPERRSKNIFDVPGEIMRKGFLRFIEDLWKEKGDLVMIKIGPRQMFLAVHPEHVRQISITNRKNYDKLGAYDTVRKLLLGNGLVTSTGETWRRQRSLMAPYFTPRYIDNYYEVMLREGEELLKRWEILAKSGETVDMTDEMMGVTASIILKTMFSTSSGTELHSVREAVEYMIRFTTRHDMVPIQLPLWAPTPSNLRYHRSRKIMHNYIHKMIDTRRNIPETEWPNDLLSKLMLARDEGTQQGMSDDLLRDELITIFFAGHETTAKTLTFLWYAVSQHPQVETRLHHELDAALAGRLPTVDDLKQLTYTFQVIKETIRLYPAAPVYIRDVVEDDVVDGVQIPAGSTVLLSPYLTHRHLDFWENPEAFNPDHWLPETEQNQHPYAYHPFAAGQRICLGNNFSLFETQMLVAILASHFAPRPTPGHVPELEMAGTLASKNGMPMKIINRI